jgi:hypothetical protein
MSAALEARSKAFNHVGSRHRRQPVPAVDRLPPVSLRGDWSLWHSSLFRSAQHATIA